MKTSSKIIWGLLAVAAVSALAFWAYAYFSSGWGRSLPEYLSRLKASGGYAADSVDFRMTTIGDTLRDRETREYFRLDTLYAADATSWEKSLAIAAFVARNIPHENHYAGDTKYNAIALWEYTQATDSAFNCRQHALMMRDLLVSAGIEARVITCMPADENDWDCHVVNHVWLPELGKWAMLDSDMDGNWASDEQGLPLSLPEMRQRYIDGRTILYHPRFGKAVDRKGDYYAYMAKNLFWFESWEAAWYDQEPSEACPHPSRLMSLVPEGFSPFFDGRVATTDSARFWAAPE